MKLARIKEIIPQIIEGAFYGVAFSAVVILTLRGIDRPPAPVQERTVLMPPPPHDCAEKPAPSKAAIAVKVGGVIYAGEINASPAGVGVTFEAVEFDPPTTHTKETDR